MGVRHGHRATDRHRRRQPVGRGRGRDHGADPQSPPWQRGLPCRGFFRGGDAGGAGRVRGGAAPQRGRPVVSRRTLAAVILGAWIVSLGWLVKREVFQPTGARLAEAALRVPPGAAYYRLAVAERQVGFASSTIDTSGTSIRVTEVLVLQVPAVGTLHRTTAMSRATFSRTLRFEGVEAKFDGDLGRLAARGLVSGDTVLAVSLESPTDSETTRTPLLRPVVLPTLLPLRLAFGGELKPGKSYASAVFDPMLLTQRPVDVTVAAESTLVLPDSAGFVSTTMAWVAVHFDTVRAFRIEERSGGSPATAWIDAQGHIVRAANAAGFSMERTAFELAYVNFRHRDTARVVRASANPGPGEVVATTALVADAPPLPRRDTLSILRARLSGAAPAGPDFTTGRQGLVGDTLVVRRQAGAELTAAYRLPARERGRARSGARARDAEWRLQRAHRAVRGAGAGRRAPRPGRRRPALPRRSFLLSCVARGVPRRLGRGGPHARPVPRRRGARAIRDRRARPSGRAGAFDRESQARGAMIRLENLTKHYGSFVAVDDVSLEVSRGLLYGFLGPNGAGKTTTLRMIAGILRPTDGRVLLGGDDVHRSPIAAKQRLGFIPDRPFVYDKLTGAEFLRFVAALYGQEGDAVERRVAELLEVFELSSWKDELVEAYSHGMRQKLIISSALIHRPQYIVVDEPMVGLDPKAARLLKDIFRQFVTRGGTVLMSTHTLEVAEAMCDRVAIIQHGKIVVDGTVDDLRRQHRAGDATLEELFLKLTGGARVRELVEVLGAAGGAGGAGGSA